MSGADAHRVDADRSGVILAIGRRVMRHQTRRRLRPVLPGPFHRHPSGNHRGRRSGRHQRGARRPEGPCHVLAGFSSASDEQVDHPYRGRRDQPFEIAAKPAPRPGRQALGGLLTEIQPPAHLVEWKIVQIQELQHVALPVPEGRQHLLHGQPAAFLRGGIHGLTTGGIESDGKRRLAGCRAPTVTDGVLRDRLEPRGEVGVGRQPVARPPDPQHDVLKDILRVGAAIAGPGEDQLPVALQQLLKRIRFPGAERFHEPIISLQHARGTCPSTISVDFPYSDSHV